MRPMLNLDLGECDLSSYNATRLLPYLIVGSKELSSNRSLLIQENVGSVINCTSLPTLIDKDRFKYLQLNLSDKADVDIQKDFSRTAAFIESAKKSKKTCYVYCSAGQSRSATIVLAYLVQIYNMTLRDALSFVQSLRPQISPNTGFMKQLISLELRLFTNVSIDFSVYDMNRYASVEALSLQNPLSNEEIQELTSTASSLPLQNRTRRAFSNRISNIFGYVCRKLHPMKKRRTGHFFPNIEPSPYTQAISPIPTQHPIAQSWY